FSCSRSSSARVVVSEDAKELLAGVDDRVRLLGLEPLARMDAAPRDGDGVDSGRLRGADVVRRVADVRRLVRLRLEELERVQERVGVGLAAVRRVGADDDVEVL